MSDVLIRCPQCGTTQRAIGECDACHEADARYFCPNHTPGRWLDAPACESCGARFTGRPGAEPPAPASRRPAQPPSPPGAGRSVPRPPVRPVDGAWDRPAETRPPLRRERRPPPPPSDEPERVDDPWAELGPPPSWPPSGGWVDRVRPRGGASGPVRIPIPTVRVGFGSVLGCVGRLVTFAVVLLALAAMAFFGYCGPIGFAGEGLPRL